MQRLEKFGGICDCQSTRDTFLYAASVDNRGLEQTIEVLGDVVLRPQFSPEEMEFCEMAIRCRQNIKIWGELLQNVIGMNWRTWK